MQAAITLPNQDKIPQLGLGTWQNLDHIEHTLDHALGGGYRHFDCAAIYHNEAEIGKHLPQLLTKYKLRRDQIWLTSKLWNSYHAAKDVRPALIKTLEDLQTDYLDLYLMHWPVAQKKEVGLSVPTNGKDYISIADIPLAESYLAMQELVKEGLVKHIGVANFSIANLQRLITDSELIPTTNQVECHPYLQQKDLVNFCQQHNIAITAYSPLGAGARPGIMQHKKHRVLLDDPLIERIAKAQQISPAQVLLAWSLQQQRIVIPKTTQQHRLMENFNSTQINLTEQDLTAINNLDHHRRYVDGSFFCIPGSPYNSQSIWGEN